MNHSKKINEQLSSIQYLPMITIQHDFLEVIKDIQNKVCLAEDIWISCYIGINQKSIHERLRITNFEEEDQENQDDKKLPNLNSEDLRINCDWLNLDNIKLGTGLIISCDELSIKPTILIFPFKIIQNVQKFGINCMDLKSNWIITGGKDGLLRIDNWKSLIESSSEEFRFSKSHRSDLTSCRFFPSGEVLLTTSIDMSAKIFSIYPDPNQSILTTKTLFNPRTFSSPHTRSLTASAIINRGKEIITGSKDGKLRIWNVAQSKVIREYTWPDSDQIDIVSIEIGHKNFSSQPPNGSLIHSKHEKDDDDDDQSNQFIVIGLSSGLIHFLQLDNLEPIKLSTDSHSPNITPHSPLTTLNLSSSSDLIAIGNGSGTITLITLSWQKVEEEKTDLLSLFPFSSWKRNSSPINSICFRSPNSILIASDDGLPYQCSIDVNPLIEFELAGYDCDPVKSIVANDSIIFTAGGDGHVRMYHT